MEFKGYDGMGPFRGIYVDKEKALSYAMDCCNIRLKNDRPLDMAFAEMLEEWFYSGNWRNLDNE